MTPEASDNEFHIALEELSRDEQPIHLSLTKYQGWCLLSAVQLASVHQLGKNSPTVKAAVKVIRQLESLIVAGFSELSLAARCGWTREEIPILVLGRVLDVMEECSNDIVMVDIQKIEAWSLIATIQLAVRHLTFSETDVAKIARSIANQLQPLIATEGILMLLLNAGWDTRFDFVADSASLREA